MSKIFQYHGFVDLASKSPDGNVHRQALENELMRVLGHSVTISVLSMFCVREIFTVDECCLVYDQIRQYIEEPRGSSQFPSPEPNWRASRNGRSVLRSLSHGLSRLASCGRSQAGQDKSGTGSDTRSLLESVRSPRTPPIDPNFDHVLGTEVTELIRQPLGRTTIFDRIDELMHALHNEHAELKSLISTARS